MGGEADPVTGSVAEMGTVPGVGDDVPRNRVDRPPRWQCAAARDSALEGVDGGRLGSGADPVDIEVRRTRLADEQRARHIASVTGHLCTEVEQQDAAGEDGPVAGGA